MQYGLVYVRHLPNAINKCSNVMESLLLNGIEWRVVVRCFFWLRKVVQKKLKLIQCLKIIIIKSRNYGQKLKKVNNCFIGYVNNNVHSMGLPQRRNKSKLFQ